MVPGVPRPTILVFIRIGAALSNSTILLRDLSGHLQDVPRHEVPATSGMDLATLVLTNVCRDEMVEIPHHLVQNLA